jgi:hypothetical protein
VTVVPLEPDPGAAIGGDVLGGGLQVLLERGQTSARVEVHQETGGVAQIDDLDDGARGGGVLPLVGLGGLLEDPDLLGPDAVRARGAHHLLRTVAFKQVGGADEARDEGGGGAFVDLGRGADLFDAALVEDGDAVAHRQGLLLVVGDEDEGDADLALDRLEFDLHLLAQLEVEGAERFVEQQHPGAPDEGAGECDALTLTAGELGGAAGPEAFEAYVRERFAGLLEPLGLGHLADLEAVRDVLLDGHVREQRVVLEDGVHVPLEGGQPGDLLARQFDPARGRALEAGDHPQDGRLARAGRAEHREELTVGDVQVHSGHGGRLTERLPQALEPDRCCLHGREPFWCTGALTGKI